MSTTRKRQFTVEEANQRLPLVRAIVRDIVQLYQEVYERREQLHQIRRQKMEDADYTPRVYTEEIEQVERDLKRDIKRLNEYVRELTELGVELKDPINGLVDFPTKIDGRRAYLCWKLGEPEVAYWHEVDDCHSGRQSLFEGSVSGETSQRQTNSDHFQE